MEAIILAGGIGSRLASVLSDRPKPMAPIGERPFLEYLLGTLVRNGCRRILLSTGHRAEMIEQYFGPRYLDMEVVYIREDEPLGTGGALALALRAANEPSVLVLNGDTYAEVDYSAMLQTHLISASKWTMALRKVEDASRYGSVMVDSNGIVSSFGEKAAIGRGLINSGVYLVQRDVFLNFDLPRKFSIERDFLMCYAKLLKPQSFITDGYFIDIGIPEDLERAQKELPGKWA